MTIDQIINWIMGLNTLIIGAAGFFLVIGILLLVTAIYSLIYDKAFRKKYILKLGTIFFILLGVAFGIFYLLVKHGTLIL
jgi:zinc transporter ZupT